MRLQLVAKMVAGIALVPVITAGQAAPGRWVPARCDIKPGHFLVNSSVLYLKNAAETRFDDQREKDLRDAERTLLQAVTTGGQDKNPAAWYYLARYYIVRENIVGADSAFKRAEALAPTCHDDILLWRRNNLWIPSFNAGVTALNAANYDSAVVLFRQALAVYDAEPQTYTTLATAFFNSGKYDSAAVYFRKSVQAASAPKDSTVRRDALFNLGNAFFMAEQRDSAATVYADYLKVVPNDVQALARLGDILFATGKKDSAMAVYRGIIALGDSVDPVEMINAGVAIYNAAPPYPDTAVLTTNCRNERRAGRTLTAVQRRAMTVACDSVGAQALKDRNAIAQVNYQLAAQAFEAGLRRAPQSRDGLFNLSNTYLALREADKMLAVAGRLVAVDPMSRGSLRLMATAWQLKGRSDSALRYITIADSLLPVEVSVSRFMPGDSSATIGGMITNFHETGSAPQKIVFEFLNSGGTVAISQTLEVPALDAGAPHPFQVRASGLGIVGWRYHKE